MNPNDNPAVIKAYDDLVYTDLQGRDWTRGADEAGWFRTGSDGATYMIRHDDFAAMVEREHPAS